MGSQITRRSFVAAPATAGALWGASGESGLERRALVLRHNPVQRAVNPRSPLSVGNGEFAFTVDVTGLQSIAGVYDKAMPLCTQSQWGWHSFPFPDGSPASDLRMEMFDTYGRPVGYATSAKGQERLFNWLRENPHRLNLGRIGLELDGKAIEAASIAEVDQELDLWTGTIRSRFELDGTAVTVLTCCHPERDAVAAVVESALVDAGRLRVVLDFPYASPEMNASDWSKPAAHKTTVTSRGARMMLLERRMDWVTYPVCLTWTGDARAEAAGTHRIALSGKRLEFVCEFRQGKAEAQPLTAQSCKAASERHWARFWSTGGAVDLSGSTDSRAAELERRIVLSQYLTAIQCSGSAPPQETGLTCNSWYGKFHLEMHWWHAAHFALWGRTSLLERSIAWYERILPVAEEKARRQGYKGARWPKMTDPSGRDSPSNVGEMLIWQQPHPIALAELCYRAHPDRATAERYAGIVIKSAEFMTDFAVERDGRYVLGPPLIPAQENHPPRVTWNPTFELSQWKQMLGVAQQWARRAGLEPDAKWEDVRKRLSALPVNDGLYLAHENCPQTFTERNRDHPSMLGAFGVLDGQGVDKETMRRTLKKVMRDWQWPDTWGWDFPMTAMTAAKLGEPKLAIDALFIDSPKNEWLPNGHNYQRPNLPLYLPGNGGLLAAVAMMAAAWGGFPKDGWKVRHEGLNAWL
ncbi:MAG TPA: glycoside hydrolase family 65 [Bryobacteraceae bacterium]|nr:glycoside hydrolase family 65 [Bryobacteraceae bacterium]